MTPADIFKLLGGVGLFLFGMTIMSNGLKNAAGEQMRVILEHATKNKIVAVVVGIAVTMVIQSSSATDMMVIGFVNSGLMTLTQAIGVIMGANIGTTITAQITAFNLSTYAPLILFVGAIAYLFIKKNLVKHIGEVVLGFGMLFEGIAIMKEAIVPLSQSEPFIHFLSTLSNPFLAVLFGVAFTALVQSSSSSVVIFQAFAVQGMLTYDVAVYLVIGAAIGSVTPNILASLTTNRNGKRTAILNLLFNLIRAAFLMILIGIFPQITRAIQSLSPNDIGRQLANTHTIFAITAVLVELPFANHIVKLSQKIIPIRPEEMRKDEDRKLMYMLNGNDAVPSVAISQARKEIVRMGKISRDNLERAVECFFTLNDDLAVEVEETEDTVNYLEQAISEALIHLHALDLSDKDMQRVSMMMRVVADIERLSDHAENIIEYEAQLKREHKTMSEQALEELKEIAIMSLKSVDFCLDIFATDDFDQIPQAEAIENRVDDMEKELVANHIARMMDTRCDPVAGIIFTDMVSDLERCSDHAINIACALSDNPS
jgi:phosphate:Na+ symporter